MRRWSVAILGFLLAGAGGLMEVRHQVAVGVVMVVIGLGVGSITAGARLVDGHVRPVPEPRPRPRVRNDL